MIPSTSILHTGGKFKGKGFAQYLAGKTAAAFALTLAPDTGIALPAASSQLAANAGISAALLQCETQALRMRPDGTNPTAAIGLLLPVNEGFIIQGDLLNWRFINAVAGTILNVIYLG